MRFAHWFRGCLAVGLLVAVGLPQATYASAVTAIDHLVITRSPLPGGPGDPGFIGIYEGQGIFYVDLFGNGLEPPSAGAFAFSVGTPVYGVSGTFGPTDEMGGKLALDSSKGALIANAAGAARLAQAAVLLTNTDVANPVAGLKQANHTFSIYGLIDLMSPPNPLDTVTVLLSDSGPGLSPTEELVVGLRRNAASALELFFARQDFVAGTITFFDQDPLAPPAGADQVELRLTRASLGDNLVSAAYRFWDDGAPITAFSVMDGAASFFNTRGWGRAGFRASEAVVPAPGTIALLLAALATLVLVRRTRSG